MSRDVIISPQGKVATRMASIPRWFPLLFGAGATQSALFATGVIGARAFGVQGRGLLAALTLVPTLLAFIAALSSASLVTTLVARGEHRDKATELGVQSIRPMLLPATCAAVGITMLTTGDATLSVLAGLTLPALALTPIPAAVAIGRREYGRAAVLQIMPSVIYAVLLSMWYWLGNVNVSLALAFWSAGLYTTLILEALSGQGGFARSFFTKSTNIGTLRRFRRRAGIGLLGTYSPLESFRVDQLVVLTILGSGRLGLYVTALALANLPKLLGEALGSTVASAMKATGVHGWKGLIGKRLGAVCAVGAAVALAAPFIIPALFGDDFRPSVPAAVILALAGSVMASRKIVNEALRYEGLERYSLQAELLSTGTFIMVGGAAALTNSITLVASSLLGSSAMGVGMMLRTLAQQKHLKH